MIRCAVTLLAAALFADAQAEIRVRDDRGREVVLAAPARRIVSLAPHATELLFAAGAGEFVVGAVRGSNHPAKAREIPVVGDVHALDLERILTLKPDLLVTWPYTTPVQVARLQERGIAVFTTDPAALDGIATDLERLGALAGSVAQAREAAARFRKSIAEATAGISGPRVRVFYQIWGAPLYTVGEHHLITQAIHACGGENVFGSLPIPAPQVSTEAVIAKRPDTIIAGADGAVRPAWLDNWQRWRGIPAVRDQLLQVVDADRLHRPGPRFADGVAELCAAVAKARMVRTR